MVILAILNDKGGLLLAILEVKVIPVGTDDPSLSSYIRDCYHVAEQHDDVDLAEVS